MGQVPARTGKAQVLPQRKATLGCPHRMELAIGREAEEYAMSPRVLTGDSGKPAASGQWLRGSGCLYPIFDCQPSS